MFHFYHILQLLMCEFPVSAGPDCVKSVQSAKDRPWLALTEDGGSVILQREAGLHDVTSQRTTLVKLYNLTEHSPS
jgi:hypothetical protein